MRILLSFVLYLSATHAAALCSGDDYLDQLTAEDLALIDARVAATPNPNGLIWQAKRGDDVLTIVGTMHIFDPRLNAIYDAAAPYLADAALLLVEAGPQEEAAMTAAMTTQPDLIFITEGPTLPEQLDDTTWEALVTAAEARAIPGFMASKMQPWYLALSLSIPPCAMPDLAAGKGGLDKMLIHAAQANDVPIAALEPWDTLFTVMQSGSAQEQLDMLQLSLMEPAQQSAMFVAMLNSYFAADVARLWEASRLAARDAPGMDPDTAMALFDETEEMVLNMRNRAWMTEIAAAVRAHDTIMIAAGAAHLPGDAGVLNLLAQDGWSLSRLD